MADETTDIERDQAERDAARQLFGVPAAEQPPPAPATGNYVPREGMGAEQQRPRNYDERNAVGELFGTPENARNLVSEGPAETPYVRNQTMYPPAP